MPRERFLLIKACSSALWENIHHMIVMLLAAELTGRIPIIFWGTHCLYNGVIQNNAYDLYFEPISSYTIYDVMKRDYTYYPPIWKHDNLMSGDPNRDNDMYRNFGDMLASNANVIVSDTGKSVRQLIPFIKADHPLYGLSPLQMYRHLMQKYICLKPDICAHIESFYNKIISDTASILAVHMPGDLTLGMYSQISAFTKLNASYHKRLHIFRNDKFEVDDTVDQHQGVRLVDAAIAQDPYKVYHPEIRKTLGKFAIKKILVLTDHEDVLKEFANEYGSMVIYNTRERISANSKGKSDRIGTFLNNRSIGIDILTDTYSAARCDFFIGYGGSDLSHAVTRIEDWPETNIKLIYWLFSKNYNFTYDIIPTGRDTPEEADGKYKLIVKNARNSLKRITGVFK